MISMMDIMLSLKGNIDKKIVIVQNSYVKYKNKILLEQL